MFSSPDFTIPPTQFIHVDQSLFICIYSFYYTVFPFRFHWTCWTSQNRLSCTFVTRTSATRCRLLSLILPTLFTLSDFFATNFSHSSPFSR
ncbi:hypothetical protein FIBSPDRAFT_474922 [Athelia psychrophila]|uniref:Uncharacterized protein n=1 Tax=Athelia psychrophila TaxID=1759441 RepID=A0A166L5P2_9AGAM|nr:hypothetical protein FIBSPDRAFT_474922 [Fibularhizoctonia sp. CBS 109695]